jgi:transposase-like protein
MSLFPYRCPQCLSSHAVRESHPRLFDLLPRFLLLRPYRCESCQRRFYAWKK